MKKSILILIVLLAVSSRACAAESNKVMVYGPYSFPPYSFMAMQADKVAPAGLDVELAQAVFSQMQRPFQIQLAEKIFLPGIKPCSFEWPKDIFSPFVIREEWRLRTHTILLATRKNGPITAWEKLDDLKPYAIGVIAGYANDDCGPFYRAKDLKKTEFFSHDDLLAGLRDGKVDLVVEERCALVWFAKKAGMLDQLQFLPKPLYEDGRYLVIKEPDKNAELAGAFQKALAEFKKTDAYGAILKKWETGDYEIPPEPPAATNAVTTAVKK